MISLSANIVHLLEHEYDVLLVVLFNQCDLLLYILGHECIGALNTVSKIHVILEPINPERPSRDMLLKLPKGTICVLHLTYEWFLLEWIQKGNQVVPSRRVIVLLCFFHFTLQRICFLVSTVCLSSSRGWIINSNFIYSTASIQFLNFRV